MPKRRKKNYVEGELVHLVDKAFNVKETYTLEEAQKKYGSKTELKHECYFYYAVATLSKRFGSYFLILDSDLNRDRKSFINFVLNERSYSNLFYETVVEGELCYKCYRTNCIISKESIDLIDGDIVINRHARGEYLYVNKELIHRKLTRAPDGKVVDHSNGNTYDNRLSNLRVCTQAENTWNRKCTEPTKYVKTSKYKGVSKHYNHYKLDTSHRGIRISKSFSSEMRAIIYYDIISLALKGQFANINHDKSNYNEEVISRFKRLYLKNL